MRMSILKIAWPQPLRDARITNASMSAALKNPSDFISLSDEVWGIFVFPGEVFFQKLYSFGYSLSPKTLGYPKGRIPLALGFQ